MKNSWILKYILLLCLMISGNIPAFSQYDKDVFFMRGRQALADGKYSQAIENFNVLSRLDTADYWNFFFRGIAKYNLGDLRGAKQDFDRSVRINPVFTSGYHYKAITESRFGDYESALGNFEKAISLRPGNVGVYFSRGVTYFLSQQFQDAVEDFDRYIRKEPKDPSAHLNRGASYLFLGDTLKALNDYNKAIRLDRFDPEGYVRRGRLYAGQGKYDMAINDMNKAIELDTTNTFAYFNRAIMYYEESMYNEALADLQKVLEDEPGNALTLYNRGLILAQLGSYDEALNDMDRVLNINPDNVLAYFNRASIFAEMGLYHNAKEDYDKAIELFPDFARAYMNRSYIYSKMGDHQASQKDFEIAKSKINEFRAKGVEDEISFADTSKAFSALLALDAEFAQKNFDNELLQYRDIDIRLRPLYRFVLTGNKDLTNYALSRNYENPLVRAFEEEIPVGVEIINDAHSPREGALDTLEAYAWTTDTPSAKENFLRALHEYGQKHYNSAIDSYGRAAEAAAHEKGTGALYRTFYLMNRGALRAEMIDFLSSMENNVQVLTMDDTGNARARVRDQVIHRYDYSDAINDMKQAAELLPDMPYFHYNLGNLYCLSEEHIKSIESYTNAIKLYPYMGDAYFNRGLVLIYLKDKDKGCIDLSRAGELGVNEAYGAIKRFCEDGN